MLLLIVTITLWNLSLTDASNVSFLREPKDVTVKVGKTVNIPCDYTGTSEIAYWVINGSYYNWGSIVGDYSLVTDKEGYTLRILAVKLWMNNTSFSCRLVRENIESHTGILHVTFDFKDPTNTTVDSGDSAFFHCSSPLLANVSIIWSINGLYYVPTELPPSYKVEEEGLRILKVEDEMNGYEYRCIFQSSLLLRGYYTSEAGELTVKHDSALHENKTSPVHETSNENHPLYMYPFEDEKFHLDNDSEVTIYWNISQMICEGDLIFYLVISFEGSLINKTMLQHSDHVSFPRSGLIAHNSTNPYHLHVESMVGDDECGRSKYSIQISPKVITQEVDAKPGTEVCLNPRETDGTNCLAIWPKFINSRDNSSCVCLCYPVENCGCLRETYYNVYNKDIDNHRYICWGNLTHAMNETKIHFADEMTNPQGQGPVQLPLQNRNYTQSHKIVVADIPYSPVFVSNETNVVCLTDIYTGHNPVEEYNVSVVDITELKGKFSFSKSSSSDTTCHALPNSFVKRHCGSLYISASSKNGVGYSDPSLTKEFKNEDPSSVCSCFQEKVQIQIISLNDSSPEISFLMDCKSNAYSDIGSVTLRASLVLQSETKDSFIERDIPVQCETSHTFYKLEAETTYLVSLVWIQKDHNIRCGLEVYETFITGKKVTPLSKLSIGLIVAVVIISIICALVGIGSTALYCRYRQRRNP